MIWKEGMSDESDHEAARIASLGVRERVYRVELLHGICELAEVDSLNSSGMRQEFCL